MQSDTLSIYGGPVLILGSLELVYSALELIYGAIESNLTLLEAFG